ncbi:SPOR domain-containing protein [Plebeiibacterium sediminum]|uniref:SPOR domain-containing protein n=1 Tax=Plebeiibacterium sediminum TaxID=2992112 RepID=A0AAE3M0Q0_9BACT|nr:SPOR domain-containing protein [Plebeiobacterium sediminum]MCW3784868.1 SPOR domain-containing protein [Plebeiobacterium sediminum]
MIKKLIPFLLISFIFFSCGDKKKNEVKQVKREVVKPPVEIKDTVVPPPPPPEPEVVTPPENKFFLIAGSFSSQQNAETFKNELIQQGYDSEVIVRKTGKNQDFYKVSYKGFYDKDEAFNALAMERKQPNNEDVWLLIKK